VSILSVGAHCPIWKAFDVLKSDSSLEKPREPLQGYCVIPFPQAERVRFIKLIQSLLPGQTNADFKQSVNKSLGLSPSLFPFLSTEEWGNIDYHFDYKYISI
jgi:hypothetical protein